MIKTLSLKVIHEALTPYPVRGEKYSLNSSSAPLATPFDFSLLFTMISPDFTVVPCLSTALFPARTTAFELKGVVTKTDCSYSRENGCCVSGNSPAAVILKLYVPPAEVLLKVPV